MSEARASALAFEGGNMLVHLVEGGTISVPLSAFPRLQHATPEQLAKYTTSGRGTGLHWDALDEDISVPYLLKDYGATAAALGQPK